MFSHHSNFFEGDKKTIIAEIFRELDKLGFKRKNNPDFIFREYDTLNIEEARKLQELEEKKNVGDKQVFVLVLNSILREAQNALLKMFEEPTEETYFFIVAPNSNFLLPTLRSRFLMTKIANTESEKDQNAWDFLNSNLKDRLKFVSKMIAETKDGQMTKNDIFNFLNALEKEIYNQSDMKNYGKSLEKLLQVKSYLNDTGSSIKMLLEDLTLTIPTNGLK